MTDIAEKVLTTPVSTRVMQAYGAACIVCFCATRGIRSTHVDALVGHLLEVLGTEDLPEWDSEGWEIPLSGQRGTSIPVEIADRISASDLKIFEQLIDDVVEIGTSDMYGADTNRPLELLVASVEILRSQGIVPPSFDGLQKMVPSTRGWGLPLSETQSKAVESWCMSYWGVSG